MIRLAPDNLPRIDEVSVDPRVLAFATLCSVLSTLLFGLAPAWHASRVDLNDALKQGGTRGSIGGGSNRTRNVLIVAEVALCVVLSIGAGLLFRSFLSLNAVELGFQPDKLLVMYAHTPANTLEDHLRANRHFEGAFTQLATVPGVKSVSSAMGVPAGRYGSNGSYAVEGKHTFGPGQKLPHAGFRLNGPGYFATMGIPLLRGRDFHERDQYDTPFVAIISDSLARQTFPNEDPIGHRIQCGLDSPNWMTVVGIVGDVRQDSPASRPGPELYMPLSQHPYRANEIQVVIRTAAEPGPLVAAVRQTMHSFDPSIAIKFTTMETMLSDSIAAPRFRTFLVGTFAVLALLLAVAGVYGVMTYFVTQRTPELGVRIALGASASDVFRIVVGRALLLAAIGLVLGLGASLAASRFLSTLLFGLEPTDAVTYAGVLAAVAVVATLAAVLPALRAMRIDPVVALRQE
jgi:predicted permease